MEEVLIIIILKNCSAGNISCNDLKYFCSVIALAVTFKSVQK